MSLLIAFVALLPALVSQVSEAMVGNEPRYTVLSFYADNISNSEGEIPSNPDFSINAQIINLSAETLIIDDSLDCGIREGVTLSPEPIENNQVQTEVEEGILIIEPSVTLGFDLYFENLQKTVLSAFSTSTVEWEVIEDTSVELYLWGYGGDYKTKFAKHNLDDFFSTLSREFQEIQYWTRQASYPRGYSGVESVPERFFLNVDCRFSVENSIQQVYEEIHLEFVYEFSGESGHFPRWSLGKNVGGGFGNGFGNGAGGPGGSNGDG